MYAAARRPDASDSRATIAAPARPLAMSIPPPSPDRADIPARRATLLQVVPAVFWSFLGVRRNDAMRRDTVSIRPHQVIVVGVIVAALLVFTLLLIVRVIIANAP